MKKVFIKRYGNMVFLNFFNSKEIYSVKGFDTDRKARNWAKKYGYEVLEQLPAGVSEYENVN
jgi:hypothetical protein